MKNLFTCLKLIVLFNLFSFAAHSQALKVAVIESNSYKNEINSYDSVFKKELVDLLEGDFEVEYKHFKVGNQDTYNKLNENLTEIYFNDEIDLVLVLDVPANQLLGLRENYTKPTFLPIVFSAQLLNYPFTNQSSGKQNLNYTTTEFNISEELKAFAEVMAFKNVVLVSDERVLKSIDKSMLKTLRTQASNSGFNITFRPFTGTAQELLISLPEDTEAVVYGAFPSRTLTDVQSLIDAVNSQALPSFSLSGEKLVELGALATNSPDRDWLRLARRNALNIRQFLEGTPVKELPVYIESSKQLTINMKTSRKIHYAPSFDVLSNAILIKEDEDTANIKYSLHEVALKAVEVGLPIIAQKFRVRRADKLVNEVRGGLLPRIDAATTYSVRRESNGTRAGIVPRSSVDGTLTLSQAIFSERLWAAYSIEKYNYLAEKQALQQTKLDIIQSAVNSYLEVLRRKTELDQERYNLNITRRNYQLAENRVKVGSSKRSDLFRWESELANAKRSVLLAKASLETERQNLNRILNRPISESFSTSVETLDNPYLLVSNEKLKGLVDNRYSMIALADFFVQKGIENSPELQQLSTQIKATQRQIRSNIRAYWLPDFNLNSTYTHNFDEDRVSGIGGIPAEENDIQLNLQTSIPLVEGGAKFARTAQSRMLLNQLRSDFKDAKNIVEQTVRNNMELLGASYNSIELARTSEKAAQENYELIVDSYIEGEDSIVTLLDAQEALIAARQDSQNAVYSFLVDLMNLQRSIGAFDFFLSDGQQSAFVDELVTYVTKQKESVAKGRKEL